GDVAHAEEHARSGAEHDAVVLVRSADLRAEDQQAADTEEDGLEADHRGEAEARVRAVRRRERQAEEHQAAGGQGEAPPLARPDRPNLMPQAKEPTKSLKLRVRPLLFVDIDGVISLFGFTRETTPEGTWTQVDGIAHLLSATAARHLHALADCYELVWCSGWEEKAN